MTEPSEQALIDDAEKFAASLDNSTRKYSDEAKAEYGLAVAGYGQRVRGLAEGKSSAEMVLKQHVHLAVSDLGPDPEQGFKTALDWFKRIGFLVAGLTIGQGVKVYGQNPIERGSVVWLLSLLVVTVVMLTAAFVLDFPQVRRVFDRGAA